MEENISKLGKETVWVHRQGSALVCWQFFRKGSEFYCISGNVDTLELDLLPQLSSGFRCGMGAACPSRTMLTQWPQQTNPSHADPKWRFLPIFQSTEKLPWGFLCNPMEEKGVAPQNDWLNFLPVWQFMNSKVCLILFKENKLIWHCRLTWL